MIIYGKNPVRELLLNPSSKVEEIFVLRDVRREEISELVKIAKERDLKVSFVAKDALTRISNTSSHQGIAALISQFDYHDVSEMLNYARDRGENPLLVILDHIEDPQNLGAIIRTVNFFGAHGIIIPKDRAASITPSVIKASAGAANSVLISRVVNIVNEIRNLKKRGFWIVGAEVDSSSPVYDQDFSRLDLALVIGGEGRGLKRLVKEECDFLVNIPNEAGINSLNASVAAGIIIYEITRQRELLSKGGAERKL